PFDLASLTKVIATTTILMEQVRTGMVRLDEPIADCFEEWRGADREAVTIQDLLEHSSGLPARLVDQPPAGRREFEHDICTMQLEYDQRSRSIYSDLVFILLGFLIADRAHRSRATEFEALRQALSAVEGVALTDPLTFDLDAQARHASAPTIPEEDDARRGR